MLLIAAILLSGSATSGPSDGWSAQLESFQRGLHARSLGYLDAGQVLPLDPDVPATHPVAGELRGFRQIRRLTGVLEGPDSVAALRGGLEGSWQSEVWAPDVYLWNPPEPDLSRTAWSAGLSIGWVPGDFHAMAGLHHSGPQEWSGEGERSMDPETDLWAVLRWRRAGALGAVDRDGPALSRISLLSDPERIPVAGAWFLPLLEGSAWWERADWNSWEGRDAWGGEVRIPVFRDRVEIRAQGGSAGFRFAQVGSNVDPQGEVGLDVSVSKRRSDWLPGFRLRVPLLTFSLDDPDDMDEFRMRGALVWSLRLRMVWEDGQTWYAPGRRPSTSTAFGSQQ